MLSDQQYVRIPRPFPIPSSVNRAMSQPMTGHRDQETSELLQRIEPKLKSSIIELSTGTRAAQETYLEGVSS